MYLCMYVTHALECNQCIHVRLTSFSYSTWGPRDRYSDYTDCTRRPLPTPHELHATCSIVARSCSYSTHQASRMSKRTRQLANLHKRRQRSCTTASVQREEAKRHQQGSRAHETDQRRWMLTACHFFLVWHDLQAYHWGLLDYNKCVTPLQIIGKLKIPNKGQFLLYQLSDSTQWFNSDPAVISGF